MANAACADWDSVCLHFDLQDRLERYETSINSLVELIPAQYYIHPTDNEVESKFMHNKKGKAPKQAVKEATKKAKKLKLDPDNQVSMEQAQKARAARQQAESENALDDDDDDDDDEDDDHDEDDDGDEDQEEGQEDDEGEDETTNIRHSQDMKPMARIGIAELKSKLQSRIAELRANRKAPPSEPLPDGTIAKGRLEVLERRTKRKREKEEASKKDSQKKPQDTVGMRVESTEPAEKSKKGGLKEQLSFGTLEFGDGNSKKQNADVFSQLKRIENKKAKLEQLKEADPSKAEQVQETEKWKRLNQLAQGQKLKDDPTLLKKTIKRIEKQKTKSTKQWGERKSTVRKQQSDKIAKREQNIKARMEGTKAKGAKGKKRPGFEGGLKKKK
ncbi:surfeit locus protein 6-domain-containing protein [Polychytrium aggregatum]|uniref:surfeit locus protein 6-domain-containing protein n=1 Tax=Polychytrium aggregatum TaxID=110093 RepID=UPI0022FEEAD6|nr:surfeit locus protein 6-domain-containing protein [Polychytrium aggregatum]KAI9199227.1 surfeit locus protein 6-domain-containing protein [Polychytrium aggregatum]